MPATWIGHYATIIYPISITCYMPIHGICQIKLWNNRQRLAQYVVWVSVWYCWKISSLLKCEAFHVWTLRVLNGTWVNVLRISSLHLGVIVGNWMGYSTIIPVNWRQNNMCEDRFVVWYTLKCFQFRKFMCSVSVLNYRSYVIRTAVPNSDPN